MPVNTAALKTFAPAMRRQLLEAVGRKLDLLLHSQTPDTLSTYAKQIAELREQEEENREQLLERVAYTWFNRLCALRYLDARGWHPFGCKVLMPATEGETQPELLKLTRAGNLPSALQSHTDQDRLHGLLDGQIQTAIAGADPQGEVYRQLVLAVCRCYHELLPNLFEGLDDASELLLPDDLLSDGSVVGAFRKEINDDDCQDVESLGWLYQFYIAEKKDEVMARKKAVPTEDIPAVTQLFTPHWIVRYLVENSLGRLWLLNRPGSKLREQMPYHIEGDAETDFLAINKPEEIKLLDPACGSGHMLTYAFDLLVLIYEEEGYSPNEISGLILKHNLHGLEICPRAAQLAELALVFKAREQSRRFFQPEQLVRPQIIELQDVHFAEGELNDYIEALHLGELFDPSLFKLLHQFEEAKNFGSLIQPCLDEQAIADARRAIGAKDLGGQFFLRETHLKVLRVLEQAGALTQRYHVVVANPPYMGGKQMNVRLKTFAVDKYLNAKSDAFAMFIQQGFRLATPKGYTALVTMHSWMFLSSYEDLRREIIEYKTILAMNHLGSRAFDAIGGEVVQATAFVCANAALRDYSATYVRLVDGRTELDKQNAFLNALANPRSSIIHRTPAGNFRSIPGLPIAYWASKAELDIFSRCPTVNDFFDPRQGMATGDNSTFVRDWFEVSLDRSHYNCSSKAEAFSSGKKWFPYNKGGGFLRWYGNHEDVVAFDQSSYTVLKSQGNHCPSENLYFLPSAGWSKVSTGMAAFRIYPRGFIFDVAGCSVFAKQTGGDLELVTAFLNSVVVKRLLSYLSPTLNFEVGTIKQLPFAELSECSKAAILDSTKKAISIARADWNNLETSWDFTDLPLLRQGVMGKALEESWRNWEAKCINAIRQMQALETENNQLFITAYGLHDELDPQVSTDQITLARPNPRKDIAAFLSYAIGCMMGRYSLNEPGLIYAGSGNERFDSSNYINFPADSDGIIPILDSEWFEDDIVARSNEFLVVTFPDSNFADNLRFIEESLGKDIRKYFCTDFYKDHLQTYKKRPIYWQIQSPKKGFSCLIYLHRYTKDTLNQVLNNYFRPYLQKLEARLVQLGLDQLNDDLPARERTSARKEAEKIAKVLNECQAWEQDALLPLAQQRIELNLDDGVKVNYLKLQEVLTPIPGLAAKDNV